MGAKRQRFEPPMLQPAAESFGLGRVGAEHPTLRGGQIFRGILRFREEPANTADA